MKRADYKAGMSLCYVERYSMNELYIEVLGSRARYNIAFVLQHRTPKIDVGNARYQITIEYHTTVSVFTWPGDLALRGSARYQISRIPPNHCDWLAK